jgi:hypothetical protein
MSGCSCYSPCAQQPSLFWQENNLGVLSLESGDYARAFHLFRSALGYCKADLDDFQRSCYEANASIHGPSQQQALPPQGPLSYSYCSEGCIRYGMTASSFTATPLGMDGGVNDESMIMIHAQAIPMIAIVEQPPTGTVAVLNSTSHCCHPRYHFFSADPVQDKNICSAVIIFNLGLVFHLHALRESAMGGRSSSLSQHRYLTKALRLYQQASRLLSGVLHFGTPTGNALIDLVMLALINNSADLSLMLQLDQETSKALFGQLLHCALSIRVSSARYRESQWIEPLNQCVESFLLNVMISRLNPSPSAAAA